MIDPDFNAKHKRDNKGEFALMSGAGGSSGSGNGGGEGGASKHGPFGPILTQYRHDAKGAVKKLLELKDGEAIGALYHPDVGDIDLVWGKEGNPDKDYEGGYGLAKIAAKHPEVLDRLQEILSSMKKIPDKSGKNRLVLESSNHEAVVSLNWYSQKKIWLITEYTKNDKRGVADTRIGTTSLDGEGGQTPRVTAEGRLTNASNAILSRIAQYYKDNGGVHSSAADFKRLVSQVAERDRLARALSEHIGAFDSADMTRDEVARYGIKKLGIKAAAGQEGAVLSGYLQGRAAPRKQPATAASAPSAQAADSANQDNFVTRYLKRASCST
ncbi:MAG: hypothetical protein LBH31_01560 [Burkholderiaceae bacterium]|jgi:hypothetical protein|nr:hypothetical protein [Burkholderiaceae bacterium]